MGFDAKISVAYGLTFSFIFYLWVAVALTSCNGKPDSGVALAEKVASCPAGGEAKAAVAFSGEGLAVTVKVREDPAVLVILKREGGSYVYDRGGDALGISDATAKRGACSSLCSKLCEDVEGPCGECVQAKITSTDLCVAAMGPVCRRVGL